jgi:hypothetical protein
MLVSGPSVPDVQDLQVDLRDGAALQVKFARGTNARLCAKIPPGAVIIQQHSGLVQEQAVFGTTERHGAVAVIKNLTKKGKLNMSYQKLLGILTLD